MQAGDLDLGLETVKGGWALEYRQFSGIYPAAEARAAGSIRAIRDAFVPREPLVQTYATAAREVARRELRATSHSMALEDQSVNDADEDDRLRRLIEDELDPREVWASRS